MKQDSSDSSLSNSDSSDDSDYIRKRRKNNKSNRKNNPIKLCATLTAKLVITSYKSNIIKFKLDEYPLQHQIYFLSFVESREMIFS